MAGGKETPRQKMIGMMYLVLTALLALNVSKEIINAFVKLDQKLMESNMLFLDESDEIMLEFENAMILKQNKASVKPYYDKAIKVREMTYEIDRFINIDCKNELIKSVENTDWISEDKKNYRFKTRNPMEIETKDDYDAATRLFGGESGTEGFERGAEIRNKIHQYRDELLSYISEFKVGNKKYKFNPSKIDQSDSSSISKTLEEELKRNVHKDDRDKIRAIYKLLTLPENIKDNEDLVAWQLGTFDHAPIVAASAMFTALSNDIRNSEMKALELLRTRINPDFVKVNKVEVLASARTNYINQGDSLDLMVMMAAFDTTDVPLIKYGIDKDTMNESAWKEIKGKIRLNGQSPGVHHVKGVMGIKEKGVLKWKPWKFAYEVGEPMAAFENIEMKVLYADYDNKIKATASGYASDKISMSGSGGINPTRSNEHYIVKPSKNLIGQIVELRVSGKNSDGTSKSLGTSQYKVRQLPTPTIYVNNTPNTKLRIRKIELLAGTFTASYPPEIPISTVRFSIKGFELNIYNKGLSLPLKSTTNEMTKAQLDAIRAMPVGSSVTFTGIKILGPGGNYLPAPTITFIIE